MAANRNGSKPMRLDSETLVAIAETLEERIPSSKESAAIIRKAGAFLEHFDAYVEARAQLKASEDGSDDEQRCIIHCAAVWSSALAARGAIA